MPLFYPSHDIALAYGVRHFNPPAAALRLQEDLASLHHIWNQPYEMGAAPMPLPWGWDWDTRQHIHSEYKINSAQLPTDEELQVIRELSSRETTIRLIEQLNRLLAQRMPNDPELPYPTPHYLQTMEEVEAYIATHTATQTPFVLKTPWSSSGRGLTRSTLPLATLRKHAEATLRRMGGIMAEEWIEGKVQDFAMLFYASDQEVRLLGYSLFDNEGTTYRQGYLLSNEEIERRLEVEPARLRLIGQCYTEILSELLAPLMGKPWHLGYLGIDMMTYRRQPNDTRLCIAPCVEMNLRCTMGVVCRLWYDQHREEGIFRITPMEENGHFRAEMQFAHAKK